ncbi:uncharacterized protein LOC123679168 [Harmonia axyridis]|uniref:uncharacterized protein LOC123679168 n=1 Tax=Harmonia axyridis TaxID=115357 RepID=UPI001E2766EC|nr:uncharacterized protein LOC123679168 [Harmonia axyridis]
MKWLEDETINFIEIYRKYDLLWDPQHRDYFHKLKKNDAWEEIAEKINKPVDECRKKMEYLLAAMRREKMKMGRVARASIRKGVNEVYRSSWFAFQSMMFLWDKNKPKAQQVSLPNTSGNQENPEREQNDPMEPSDSMEFVAGQKRTRQLTKIKSEQNAFRAKKRHLASTSTSSQKKKLDASPDESVDKALDMSTSTASHSATLDDCYHFGNLVASKLRLYNDDVRCAIERDILNIFIGANSGYYNSEVNILPIHVYENPPTSHGSSLFSSSPQPPSPLQRQTQLHQSTQQYLSPNDYGEESEDLKQEPLEFPSTSDN